MASAGEEVDRLIRLAEDLLTLAAAGRGPTALHRTQVRLADLAGSAVAPVRDRARSHQVSITVAADGASVSVDRGLLRQALANLLDNALRHAPPGSTIAVRAGRHGDRVRLTVADQGAGFPKQFVGQALEPFARSDLQSAGSGLGLAIVDAVARAHGGAAVAGNQPSGGVRDDRACGGAWPARRCGQRTPVLAGTRRSAVSRTRTSFAHVTRLAARTT